MISTIALLAVLLGSSLAERKQLEFVQMMFRHGDRAPSKLPYRNDPYPEKFWPNGWDQLTEFGYSQMRERGKYFRNRYSEFLGDDSSEIFILSSPINRSVLSAQAFASGFFETCDYGASPEIKAGNCDKFVKLCNETDPADEYPYIGHLPACKKYAEYVTNLLQEEKARVEARYSDVLQFLQKTIGKLDFDNRDLRRVYHVQKEMFHNLSQPAWVFRIWPNHQNRTTHKIAEEVYLSHLYNSYGVKEVSRFAAGTILSDFVRNTQNVEAGIKKKKFIAYSSHDTIIMALMSLFGVFDQQLPPFGATFIMEVYSERNTDDKKYNVQLSYLSSGAKPTVLQIPGCDDSCPLNKFIRLFEKKGFKNEQERTEFCQDGSSFPMPS